MKAFPGNFDTESSAGSTVSYRLCDLFGGEDGGRIALSGRVRHRDRGSLGGRIGELILDRSDDGPAACCFARFSLPSTGRFRLEIGRSHGFEICPAGGWLLHANEPDAASYWLPEPPIVRNVDNAGHLLSEHPAIIVSLNVSANMWAVELETEPGKLIDCIIWQIPSGNGQLLKELISVNVIERQHYFLWGSHDAYARPADVYRHLIHGHVYEDRFSWPKRWKICSENDAHALYTVLSGLEFATGKQIYRLLKDQLLLSILDRQSEDGGWRHGEWSNRMESHYRLHCSAMHMLMDALAEKEDPTVQKALERAAAFLARQTDKLEVGVWFLHDELEHSVEAMREGPFRWLPSRALGKSESNMLVLNSHLDATVALDRYHEVTGDAQYELLVAQAVAATRTVLSLRPANWLYKPLFRAIRLTFLPAAQAAQLPLHLRALKRVAWKYLIPTLPRIKALFPRIVMPGGYIDRELSLRIFAHEYLPINLMDLLRYRHRFPDEALDEVILSGLALVQDCRMLERWLEVKGKEYAVGFWAEALYQACLAYPDAMYRAALAQAVAALEKRDFGLPPSLLGANGEAVGPSGQTPSPVVDDARIRVVNLSRSDVVEVLLINCSSESARPRFLRNALRGVTWTKGGSTEGTTFVSAQEIAAGDWLWGRGVRLAGLPS